MVRVRIIRGGGGKGDDEKDEAIKTESNRKEKGK